MKRKKTGRKGLSVFISHVLAIAILFVVLIVVSSQLYNYYYSIKEQSQQSQALVLSQRVADNVLTLYTNYKESDFEPPEGENRILSVTYVNIPEKISGNNYILSLEQHGDFWIEGGMENESSSEDERSYTFVKVEIDGKPSATYTYPIYNVVANVIGSVRRTTKVKLSYIREKQSGELNDFIIMERA